MNNQYTSNTSQTHDEDCAIMAAVVSAIGFDYGFRGMQMLLDGCEKNDSDLSKEGLRMMLGGSGLTVFAPLIQDGRMTVDQLLKYLDRR